MFPETRRSTPDFIAPDMWPPNSPDLNPVDYARSIMQQHVYQTRVHDIDDLRQHLITCDVDWNSALRMTPLISGNVVREPVLTPKADILNIT